MRIDELLASADEPVFSFEFFPPKTEEGEQNLFSALGELRALEPAFVSVTYGAGGGTSKKTIEVIQRIQRDFGLEAMAHFTCVGATVEELRATLDQMREVGIENVLALRGDPPEGSEEWRPTEGGLSYSRELVELIDEHYDFAIGGACFPETHIHALDSDSDLRFLRDKVDAGARFLVTQLFFDNRAYFEFVERARAIGIEVPIIPGVMPIQNFAQIARITSMIGADLPAGLRAALEAREGSPEAVRDLGVAFATLQCAELLRGGAPGIHFYTMNRSPATRAILAALKLMRPWDERRSALGEATLALG
jgi:methylenetetrahydrofolate reductase (NADPH)